MNSETICHRCGKRALKKLYELCAECSAKSAIPPLDLSKVVVRARYHMRRGDYGPAAICYAAQVVRDELFPIDPLMKQEKYAEVIELIDRAKKQLRACESLLKACLGNGPGNA